MYAYMFTYLNNCHQQRPRAFLCGVCSVGPHPNPPTSSHDITLVEMWIGVSKSTKGVNASVKRLCKLPLLRAGNLSRVYPTSRPKLPGLGLSIPWDIVKYLEDGWMNGWMEVYNSYVLHAWCIWCWILLLNANENSFVKTITGYHHNCLLFASVLEH